MSNTTALEKIKEAEKLGALICFDKTNFFPEVDLYRTEVTSLTIDKKEDCHFVSKKYMPKKEMVDRMGEAAGVIFTMGNTSTQVLEDSLCGKRTVYIATAQGKIRMPDGTWRMSSICDYEFDPTLRAMDDYDVTELNAQTKQQRKKDDNGKERAWGDTLAAAILDYQKTARQRANTGARLRVIRELLGTPIAFTEKQLEKPLLLARIVQNTSYILNTPEGRVMATAQALGADVASLFGKPALPAAAVTATDGTYTQAETTAPENKTDAAAATAADDTDDVEFPVDDEPEAKTAEAIEFEDLTAALDQFLTYKEALNVKTKNGVNPYELAIAELENKNATIESRRKMLNRVRDFLIGKKVPGVV